MENYSEFQSAFNYANKQSRDSYFSWVKVVISITTPSLILLIGLQDKNQNISCETLYLLVGSIILMSLTILSGLIILHSESNALHQYRDKIAENWEDKISLKDTSVELPNYYKYISKGFTVFTFLSILTVTVFGVLKYIT